MTMRGHLDWHASSNGKKYLSASTKLVFDLIGGKVLEPDLPSPLGGLRRREKKGDMKRQVQWSHDSVCQTKWVEKKAGFNDQPDTLTATLWHEDQCFCFQSNVFNIKPDVFHSVCFKKNNVFQAFCLSST